MNNIQQNVNLSIITLQENKGWETIRIFCEQDAYLMLLNVFKCNVLEWIG